MTISAAFLLSMSVVAAQVDADPMDDPSMNVEEPAEEGAFEETGEAIDEAAEETGEALEEAAEDTGEAVEEARDEMQEIGEPQLEGQEIDAEVRVEEEPSVEVERHDADVRMEEPEPTAQVETTESDVDINVDFAGADEQRSETLLGMEPVGAMLMVGGGAVDFATAGPEEFTQTGGYWNARIAGTRTILSAEAAYIGRAHGIEATGLSAGSTLLGNGVEGLVRLNAPFETGEVLIEPFAVAGGSWEYFTILNEGANTSSINDNDVAVFLPVGVGLAAAWQGLSVDVRGLYRHAFLSEMFGDSGFGLDESALNTWQLGANLGFEF